MANLYPTDPTDAAWALVSPLLPPAGTGGRRRTTDLLCDHIGHLYIAPTYQHRGIGDQLLAIAKELHPYGLTLWTFQQNARTRRFYEARDFVASEFTDGLHNEEGQPDVLHTWRPRPSSGSV